MSWFFRWFNPEPDPDGFRFLRRWFGFNIAMFVIVAVAGWHLFGVQP